MTPSRTDRAAAGVIACAFLLVGVLVNLPFEYSQHGGYWVDPNEPTGTRIGVVDPRPLTHAGWPIRFLSQHQREDVLMPVQRHWSPTSLCFNILVFLAGAIAAFLFVLRRRRTIGSSGEPASVQLRFDLAAACALIAIPVVTLAIAFVESRRHKQLANELSRQGNCYLVSSMPSFLAERMPHLLVDCFSKIRSAEVFVPNDQQVRSLLSLDSLIGCSLHSSVEGDTAFDLSLLQAVADHPQLSFLALRNMSLNDQAVEWISRVPYLTKLTFNNNNLTDEQLQLLATLDQLSAVRLINNPCRYAAIPKTSKWLQTIRSLDLSCPVAGIEDSLTLENCPRIERVTLTERVLRDNPAEFSLTVANCPLLSTLILARVQKYALRLRNLPRVNSFGQDMSMTAMYAPPSTHFPGAFWCSRLELESLPNLSRVKCLSTDLESVFIRDVPNIRSFSLGSFQQLGGGRNRKIEVRPERVENLLDQLGQLKELETLRLELCSLQDVDVTKFAENRSIKQLHFAATDITVEQARQLTSMKQLTDLQLGECALTSDDVSDFLSDLPNLRSLGCNVYEVDDLRIENNTQLERLSITAIESANSVRIQNVPQLRTSLFLLSAPQELTVLESPGLLNLVVDGQWPKSAELSGLRMLRCFAGGGPELDDYVLDKLRYCTQLDELALAYANVSQESLRTIRQFKKLTTLYVPAAPVDDSVVESWRPIRRLQHINLDETNVGVGTIRWATNLPNLKSFSVNDVSFSEQACEQIAELGNIQRLGLARTNVNKNQILRLLAPGRVAHLTLGGLRIDDELIDSMVANKSLKSLTVEPADLNLQRLKTLLQRCPDLEIQFTQPNDGLTTELRSELNDRSEYRRQQFTNRASETPMPDSNDARLEHISAEARAAIESTIRVQRTPGKLNLERLRQSLAKNDAADNDVSSNQNGASSSSTASDNAALASSTAAPVTPP